MPAQSSRTRVLALCSAKGGSGKTTLAASFGRLLAAVGLRVLLVDADEATMGLTLLHLKEVEEHRHSSSPVRNSPPAGLFELAREITPGDLTSLSEGLDLLPAAYSLERSPVLWEMHRNPERIAGVVDSVRSSYDVVLLDAEAGAEETMKVACSPQVSDSAVIVSEFDPMSLAGIRRLEAAFPDQLHFERRWVLLNKVLPELVEESSTFLEVHRYLPPIAWNPDVVRAYARRTLALDLNAGNEYTYSVVRSLQILLGAPIAQRIDKWVSGRVRYMMIPLRQRREEIRDELDHMQRQRDKRLAGQRRLRLINLMASILLSSLAVTTAVLSGASSSQSITIAFTSLAVVLVVGTAAQLLWLRRGRNDGATPPGEQREAALLARLDRIEALLDADEAALFAGNPPAADKDIGTPADTPPEA